ncbi:MAG: hypothetical protein ACFFAE_02290 [Candidatus Hodarchaeota archaeon]
MIQRHNKFPFKYFLGVIEALEGEDALSSWQIANSIGSCTSDASEVTRMLHYLTHYGKVVSNADRGNWRIIRKNEDSNPPSKDFRVKYIQKYLTIIELLTGEPQSEKELSNKASLELNEVKEALSYLKLITEKGYIYLQGSGPRQQWKMQYWPQSFS